MYGFAANRAQEFLIAGLIYQFSKNPFESILILICLDGGLVPFENFHNVPAAS